MPLPAAITRSSLNGRAENNKGNDGSAARRRLLIKGIIYVMLVLLAYHLVWTYYWAGVNIPEWEVDETTGRRRRRRRPARHFKHDHTTGQDVPTSPFDGIMEGYLSLINLRLPNSLQPTSDGALYSGVTGTFCQLRWNLQADDPSTVPMFKDLQSQSPLCHGTLHSVDLATIAQQARDYDARNHTFVATEPQPGQQQVPPTAVVFHESRCGSTLVANLLASFAPDQVRVYSESPPPVTALKACERTTTCHEASHIRLIQDVFYMMGRTTRPVFPQYVFYKIQSIGVQQIARFIAAQPRTPWMYVYRNSVEVMMSHFKNFQQGNPLSKDYMPVCLRNYGHATHPAVVEQVVAARGRDIKTLNQEEYCAAHLAGLSQSAVNAHEHITSTAAGSSTTTRHWFINYADLPHIMWEKILPKLVGPLQTAQKDHMAQTAHVYSKGRGPRAQQKWKEDATVKQSTAPQSVKDAVALFLDPVYSKMERIKNTLMAQQH